MRVSRTILNEEIEIKNQSCIVKRNPVVVQGFLRVAPYNKPLTVEKRVIKNCQKVVRILVRG